MPRPKKEVNTETTNENVIMEVNAKNVTPNDIEWTDHVLACLSDDEKISGNPTTDGLRRIFETVLNCVITDSSSKVEQAPSPENEKRATVIHSITYVLKDEPNDSPIKYKTVSGAADVYWGNCDKIYRNHPVAVAETRAEGRALRRALKLRKVVAAEEIAKDIEDNPDGDSVYKISPNQLNFMDVLAKRLDVNMTKILESFGHNDTNVYNIEHSIAVDIIKKLSSYQQNMNNISEDIKGYNADWK